MTITRPMTSLCPFIGCFLQLSRHANAAHMPILEAS
jgi:hypothetical protein